MRNQAAELRRLLRDEPMIVAPGVVDALGAKIAARHGFKMLYMTGSGVAATLGFPDIDVVTLTEQTQQARVIARSVDLPLVIDAEGGFGNAPNIARTVRELEDAGVAGFHLEDQLLVGDVKAHNVVADGGPAGQKPSTAERYLLDPNEMVRRVKIAIAARRNPDTVIIARTDAVILEDINAAVRRGNIYADAGADLVMVNGTTTLGELEFLAKGIKAGLVTTTSRLPPTVTTDDLRNAGVKIPLFATQGLRIACGAMDEAWSRLKRLGAFSDMSKMMMSSADYRDLTGLTEAIDEARKGAGG